jgi:hypothetical protein
MLSACTLSELTLLVSTRPWAHIISITFHVKKTVFITERLTKNIPPYQHTVCAPIWKISHIVATPRQCGLQRNDQYGTHNQRLFPLLLSNYHRKEQLVLCSNLIKCSTELVPGKSSLQYFCWTKKSIRSKPIGFGFSGLFDFVFLSCPNKFSMRWIR